MKSNTFQKNIQYSLEDVNFKNMREEYIAIETCTKLFNDKLKKLKKEISKLKKQTDKKVDEKYKTFWEDEVKSHSRTKEELKKPKAKPKNTNDNDDIYGSDEKGWWSGGSNLMGK